MGSELIVEKSFIPLVQNLVFLISLVAIYSLGQYYLNNIRLLYQQLIFGIIFGVITTIGILSPISITQGIVIDPRAIIVLATGLFVGTTAAFITAGIALVARILVGGIGVIAGVGVILIVLVMVVIVRQRWPNQLHQRPNSFYLALGVAVLAAHVPFVILVPSAAMPDILMLAIPLALFFVVGTFLLLALLAREKRQLELANDLSISEGKTRSLYELMPDMLLRVDRAGRILEVKPAASFAPLFPPDQLIGKKLDDVVPADIASTAMQRVHDVLTTHQTVTYEYQLEGNGESRDYEARMVASGADEVVAIIRDVTDQKRAERTLRESEEQVASIINTMPTAVYIYDLVNLHNVYLSPVASRILGYTPAEVRELGDKLFEHMTHPDDIAQAQAHLAHFQTVADGEIIESEGRRRHGKGHWLDLHFSEVVFTRNPDGSPRQILGTFRDITDTKKSAGILAYQANLLEHVSDAIIATDNDFTITSWNKAAEKIYGFTAEEAIGRRVSELTQPEFADGNPAGITSAFNKQGFWSGEYIQTRKDGKKIHVETATTLLKDANNQPIGAVAVNRDITESKQLEQRERDWRMERAKMDLLNAFTGSVAHDFRTPISTIITSLYLLRQEHNPEKQAERIDMVETQVMRLNQYIDDILMMIRLDSGEAYNIQLFDPQQIIERVLHRVSQTRRHSALPQIKTRIDNDVPFIWGDEIALERALYRVVENAAQFTDSEGQITVSLSHDIHSERVVISVEDTGIGITADVMPHIFERLYRGEEARPAHMGGTGMGLPIAKAIIEGHGGEIKVESIPGEGSTFRLYVPIKS